MLFIFRKKCFVLLEKYVNKKIYFHFMIYMQFLALIYLQIIYLLKHKAHYI